MLYTPEPDEVHGLESVCAALVDARAQLEQLKLASESANQLHGEISRAHGLCSRMVYDAVMALRIHKRLA